MTKLTATVAPTGAAPLAGDSSMTKVIAAPTAPDRQEARSRGHRTAWLALVLAVVIAAGILAGTLAQRDDRTSTIPRVTDESPLVDGHGFNDAVERGVVGAESTPSPLIDGAGFEQVVNDAAVKAAR
jgi:hypothetical protein